MADVTSYHVHSRWSDGETTIEEIFRAANEAGLAEIGISDHYVLMPDGSAAEWSMPVDALDAYVEAVQTASLAAGENTVVRLGLETDFFPESVDALRGALASQPFDYAIGSVHIVDGFCIDETPELWEPLTQDERDAIILKYWAKIRGLAESGAFDIVGHMDLYKKFGIQASVDLSGEISAALDAIAQSGMAVELNTSGWFKPCAEQYPSADILKACFARDIPIVVTADAHTPGDLTRAFPRAFRLLREIGYTNIVSFGGRMKYSYPIPESE